MIFIRSQSLQRNLPICVFYLTDKGDRNTEKVCPKSNQVKIAPGGNPSVGEYRGLTSPMLGNSRTKDFKFLG